MSDPSPKLTQRDEVKALLDASHKGDLSLYEKALKNSDPIVRMRLAPLLGEVPGNESDDMIWAIYNFFGASNTEVRIIENMAYNLAEK